MVSSGGSSVEGLPFGGEMMGDRGLFCVGCSGLRFDFFLFLIGWFRPKADTVLHVRGTSDRHQADLF